MARIRSLKPEFFTSEQIVAVSIPARLLFQGMWVFGDDDGYISASPVQLKMRVFPADSVDVPALLAELVDAGLVVPVDADQGSLLWVPSFLNHQSPKYPTPSKYTRDGAPLTKHSPKPGGKVGKPSGSVHPGEERRGEEREEKEDRPTATRSTRVPSDFTISDEMREWALKEVPHVNVDKKLAEWIDYWSGVPGKAGFKLDWVSTWRNGMRKQEDFALRDIAKGAVTERPKRRQFVADGAR